jgi:hypothetical protein
MVSAGMSTAMTAMNARMITVEKPGCVVTQTTICVNAVRGLKEDVSSRGTMATAKTADALIEFQPLDAVRRRRV